MCGIAGYLAFQGFEPDSARRTLKAMCDSIQHRGPDAEGLFVDGGSGVALGHRRLSIVDLSETGAQPMDSPSGRFTIVYNGEIYGFLELRQQLIDLGVSLRGTSDTEVLLAAMDLWGVHKALELSHGMFAFAVYDRKENRVVFARDRLGKKPLYIGLKSGKLLFGSELKALRAHPEFGAPAACPRAQAQYVRYGFVPAPLSIYRDVIKLPAGTLVEVQLDAPPTSADALSERIESFWDIRQCAAEGLAEPYEDENHALKAIEAELGRAVQDRMVADVPVGTFLSGGIDSTLITAIMQEQAPSKVTSFTVRFEDKDLNEADHAAAIASYLGTNHHEVTATPRMAFDLLDSLPAVYDEPFADPSAIPTLLVSQLAQRQLKVVLSGDGGDESFGGYERYARMLAMQKLAQKLPRPAAAAIASAPGGVSKAIMSVLRPALPGSMREQMTPDRLSKVADIVRHPNLRSRYNSMFSLWEPSAALRAQVNDTGVYQARDLPNGLSDTDTMMMLDSGIYLPEGILVKVDRASMSVGLEVRAPLLDDRVVAAAWRSPNTLRFNGKVGKVALRQLVDKRIPKSLYDRPKQGFGVPMNEWLRGPLKEVAQGVFSGDSAVCEIFDPALLQRRWREHLDGSRNWGPHLWFVLAYSFWHRRWMQ
ncbi:asparagine synthase (glutamine-hydrolyzing) [Ruegeria arenilitoris]|uniref:asparagine synthase (glutamine-hydrolyzing) n=1 Tax=Ruegeria arenilitoris TaxID=1173585 RepID=UPI0014799454|nr:asparagine synthase (glutamine-hydrolyzing) [Ruegeria arenilitoris]